MPITARSALCWRKTEMVVQKSLIQEVRKQTYSTNGKNTDSRNDSVISFTPTTGAGIKIAVMFKHNCNVFIQYTYS
jgi:hypothetical protein